MLLLLSHFCFVVVDVDVGIYGNHRSSNRALAGQAHGYNSPHVYAVSYTRRPHITNQPSPATLGEVTSSRRRDSLPRDERHVTFADDSQVMVGGTGSDVGGRDDDQNAGNSSRYCSSEFSDVTSVTSGSYYMDEDLHYQPVSFIFV